MSSPQVRIARCIVTAIWLMSWSAGATDGGVPNSGAGAPTGALPASPASPSLSAPAAVLGSQPLPGQGGPPDDGRPRILRVTVMHRQDVETNEPPLIHLGEDLLFEVRGLPELVEKAKASGRRWGVILNGSYISTLPPQRIDLEAGQFTYFLRYTRSEADVWARIFGMLQARSEIDDIRLGLDDGTVLTPAFPARLHLFDRWALIPLGFCVLLGLTLIWMALRSPLLRDPALDGESDTSAPFSLARVQLAGWFWIVASAFVLLWGIVGTFDVMSTSAFAVLGISGLTYAGAVAVDHSRRGQAQVTATLQAQGQPPTQPQAPTGNRQFRKRKRRKGFRSFITDLLGGENSWGFHRLQLFVWTLLLMAAFVWSCLRNLSMPVFGELYLALMGISATTYLGVKIPESGSPFGGSMSSPSYPVYTPPPPPPVIPPAPLPPSSRP